MLAIPFRERTEAIDEAAGTEAMPEVIATLYRRDWMEVPDAALEHALGELLDPRVVFVPETDAGEQPLRHVGIAAAIGLFATARGDWASCRYLVQEIDEEDDEVLVSGRVVAEVRESGARASFPFAHLWTTRDQRVVKIVAYHGPTEARQALNAPRRG